MPNEKELERIAQLKRELNLTTGQSLMDKLKEGTLDASREPYQRRLAAAYERADKLRLN